jgi:hypothetical protein
MAVATSRWASTDCEPGPNAGFCSLFVEFANLPEFHRSESVEARFQMVLKPVKFHLFASAW